MVDPTSALEQEIRRLPRIGKSPYLPTIRKHLTNGADPNAAARCGKKSIMEMTLDCQFPIDSGHRWEIMPLLVARGGNPLLHGNLLMGMLDRNSSLISILVRALVERENNISPLLSADGGNLLHVLFHDSSFTRSVGWAMGTAAAKVFPESWWGAKDTHGQSPLHILWRGLNSDHLVEAWILTNGMKDRGVRLDTGDDRGYSVHDTMCKRLETIDLNLMADEHPDVQAQIEGWLLQQTTQKPVVASALGRRL